MRFESDVRCGYRRRDKQIVFVFVLVVVVGYSRLALLLRCRNSQGEVAEVFVGRVVHTSVRFLPSFVPAVVTTVRHREWRAR